MMSKGIMRPQTATEIAANAAERWRSQYKDWNDDDKFSDGTTKGEINLALNTNPHTPEKIAEIINDGWAYPDCSCCGERCETVVSMKRGEWSDETFEICANCIKKASLIIGQAA